MNDITLLNELEQKIAGLVNALKSEREKNSQSNNKVIESQKLSKIEEHVNKMIAIIDDLGASK
jgi:flagellin-specific chaperone FliS|tara:strand:- start:1035 stop:1223 length:189 start_codon:yes stop_codon:yes gene_type:complete